METPTDGGSAPASAPTEPTVVSPPGASGAPATTNESISLSRSEYNDLQRARERASGMEKFYQTANKYGFKGEDDFKSYKQRQEELDGLPLDQIKALFNKQEPEAEDGGQFDMSKIEEIVNSKLSEADKQRAIREYEQGLSSEQKLLEEFIAKTSEGMTPKEKAMFTGWASSQLNELSSPYPEGHPLHGSHFQPLSSVDPLAAAWQKIQQESEAEDATEIGDAASKATPPSTPASRTGGQGAKDTDETPARRGLPDPNKVKAYLDAKRRRGAPRG